MPGMWIFWPVVLLLAVLLTVWLLRTAASSRGDARTGRSPEEILKERYARGEVDHDEYRRRLEELRR